MENNTEGVEEKIVLPESLQRKIVQFFQSVNTAKNANADNRQTSPNKTEEG